MNKLTYFILLIILTASSCRAPKDFVFQNVEHFSIGKAGLQQTQLSMDVKLYNTNNYRMKLKRADLDVYLNGSHLGKMNVTKKYTVPRMDTFSLPVVVNVDMSNALPNAIALFMNSEVTVKLAGSVKAGRHGIFVHIPVNYEGKQDIRSGLKW